MAVYTGLHAPFLVDDVRSRSRLWRCSRCGTLWLEGDPTPRPIGADQADAHVPGWREAEQWLVGTSLRALLQLYSQGAVDDDAFAVAALHHDVPHPRRTSAILAPSSSSGSDAAVADGKSPSSLEWGSMASRLRWMSGRRQVVRDPASPWGCELDAYVVEYLDANGRRTETESDRQRSE